MLLSAGAIAAAARRPQLSVDICCRRRRSAANPPAAAAAAVDRWDRHGRTVGRSTLYRARGVENNTLETASGSVGLFHL